MVRAMKIASFNINGVKARLPALLDWLAAASPDVAVLQEIKSVDAAFPREALEDAGYRVETHGQKSFNGVAILSRLPLEDVTRGLPGDEDDDQARYIEATVVGTQALRIAGLYLPNGNPVPGPKYDYKLRWMARLEDRMRAALRAEEPMLFGGDYNIIPQDEDAARPELWQEDALARIESRAAYRRMLNLGMTDALRIYQPGPGIYSFWDYQAGAWQKNNGIRIDHWLLTPQAADLLQGAGVDKDIRAGEKPSDHVPVWIEMGA